MDWFHQFLKQPAFGVCRGVLLRDSLLLLLYAAWGTVCLAAGYQGQGLVYLWEPFVLMPLLISLRRELLPRPIADAYDGLESDILECVTAGGFKGLAGMILDHISGVVLDYVIYVIELVASWIETVFWFFVCFISSVLTAQESSVRATVRFAWESTSCRQSLFLTHSHTLRAPPSLA
ncbi:MAG: hypothetical protein AB1555_19125 [Nitrospirota bacterium]